MKRQQIELKADARPLAEVIERKRVAVYEQIAKLRAAERRATVERIRKRFKEYDQPEGTSWAGWIDRILDEEAGAA